MGTKHKSEINDNFNWHLSFSGINTIINVNGDMEINKNVYNFAENISV